MPKPKEAKGSDGNWYRNQKLGVREGQTCFNNLGVTGGVG